jgi:processive 1,2-diacylglycerol beta-glucosyltransferase
MSVIYCGETMSVIQLFKERPDTYEREILGTITEKQLDFLVENLDEEFEEDEECFLSSETLDYLKEQGADGNLVAILEKALIGAQDGIDIGYLVE